MGKINVALKDETEDKFRKAVFESKGMKKGNISEALEEAIDLWIAEQRKLKKESRELDQKKP